ncbi:hypothetical protein BDZ45DRAFT_690645 [Acephala macrosclerotiorum]|nr:hypothetical protein BDZ45DRAFT_690645 [Acephala macrosclerotiorum]
MHSKIHQRDGRELLQAHKQMPHDSGIDLAHEISLENSQPASITTGPDSPDDRATSHARVQAKKKFNGFVGRTAPVDVAHVTPLEIINPDVLEIANTPDDGSIDTAELERIDPADPMEKSQPVEGAISEIPPRAVPPNIVARHVLEDPTAPIDDSVIEPEKINFASPINSPKSPGAAVGEVPMRLLPTRPPPPSSSSSSNSLSSIDTTVDLDLPAEPRKIQRPNENEWGKIKRLRKDVQRLRSQAHQMRKVLRDKQQARSKADDKYFQHVRMRKFQPSLDNGHASSPDQEFERLYRDCERLRDECGPLEDDCILLENDLSYHEFELEKLEDRLYERPPAPVATFAASNTGPLKQNRDSPAPSVYGGSEIDNEYHPLVYRFLSKLGDLNNLNERLDWHEDEKANLEDEKETRMRVGLRLAEEGQKWLDNYSKLERDLLQQIEKAEDEAEALRKKCFALGLVDEDGEPTDFETRERQTFITEKPLYAGNSRSEFVNFPTLLPQPSGKQEEFHDPMLDPEEETVDPRDRINGWLLHQLRMSALEVSRLAITYESKYGYINRGGIWEKKVLECWYKDGTKEGDGKSGRTIASVSSGEVTEKSAIANDRA